MPYFLRTMRAGLPPVDAAPAYATLEAAMTEAVAMIREGHHAHIEDEKGEIIAGPEAIKKQFGIS